MTKKDYTTVSFDKKVLEYIDTLLKHPVILRKYNFDSRAEFIRVAIARLIDKVEDDIDKEGQRTTEESD